MSSEKILHEAITLVIEMTGLDKGPTEEEYNEWHERAWAFLLKNDLIAKECLTLDQIQQRVLD